MNPKHLLLQFVVKKRQPNPEAYLAMNPVVG
jgi:hypothetical protein